ncbi:alpha/beta fold hydrolase [Blastococcus sp. CT_GayMR16]|uniref:alpha/beta hydrolase n=1 Tax=Blastococcus sp. CT_GayMR16 TaxID=2559607 RepID=UPI001073D1D6|nr:alpha/beta fold hydrolase [Blastococcus sp. CT_GayMR16]TFV85755.1 alpha/beta fold hydrolase [Blastococcus sp. CT_GayMR16]
MPAARVPVVFIHGLWLHSTSWQPWVERFRAAGYDPQTPEWPGVPDTVAEARKHPESQAGVGFEQIVDHHARIVAALPEPPVLIGHSFGGLVVMSLLDRGLGRAGVAIDPAQIRGVVRTPPAQLASAFPVLRNPANRKRAVSLTPAQFRSAFGNALPEEESARLHEQWTIPGPGRPLFQAALANATPRSRAATAVDTRKADRAPLLIVSGGKDRTIPDSVSRAAYKMYGKSAAVTDFRKFPDRGHSLTVDSGWSEVAEAALAWLTEQGIPGETPAP